MNTNGSKTEAFTINYYIFHDTISHNYVFLLRNYTDESSDKFYFLRLLKLQSFLKKSRKKKFQLKVLKLVNYNNEEQYQLS